MKSGRAIKILVVEDESIVAKNIQSRLKKLGYSVPVVASSGEEAIQKAAKIRPDLVLMDIVLKGDMDGVNAAKQIYSRFNIPVVYLTAYSDDKTLERAKITEPFGYLLKPFEIRELHSVIEIALYKHKSVRELKEKKDWLATTLKSMSDAVIITDSKGLITFMNPVAEALTDWSQDDGLGKNLGEVFVSFDEETRKPLKSPVKKALKKEGAAGLTNRVLLITKEGTETPVDLSAAPIKDDQEAINGVVLIFRKAKERKRIEEEIISPKKVKAKVKGEMKNPSVGLIVATFSALVREGINKMLETERDIEILALASDQSEVARLVRRNKPDILLLDAALPGLDIEQIMYWIRQENADTKVILLLHALDEVFIINVISLGVRGCLTDTSNREQFVRAIRAVSKGEIWAEVKILTRILTRLLPSRDEPSRPELTRKEEEITKFVIQGLSNKQVAKKLYISDKTIKSHLRNIFKKFGVNTRLQLAAKFREMDNSKLKA